MPIMFIYIDFKVRTGDTIISSICNVRFTFLQVSLKKIRLPMTQDLFAKLN